ncbi:MAG TPA: cation:proton antiporter [Usitatibacter sp.]|nr:cation:proton antiporter [Usitatibacter sp.]
MNASFLPTLPFQLSYALLFGVLLVAGMLGGELARYFRLPRIIGYVLVGFVFAPLTSAMGLALLIDEARIFVELALGLVLFDLGRRMDIKWMRRDWSLAASGIAQCALTFAAVFYTLLAFDLPTIQAGIAAAIAMTTSPAVLLLIIHDTRAEGQVTERALNIAALNGLLASIIVTILLGSTHYVARTDVESAILQPAYLFLGSLLLGAAMAWAARVVARAVERDREVHFTLIAGLVVAGVGLAQELKLPVILALLAFGLFSRNDERGYELLNVNLAPIGRLLYIVLFVITGASMPLPMLLTGGAVAFAYVAARFAGTVLGVLVVAPMGGLRPRQAIGLGLALLPMSSIALLLTHDIARLYPAFDRDLAPIVMGAIIVMEVVGPLAVQLGLRIAGDTVPEPDEPLEATRAA